MSLIILKQREDMDKYAKVPTIRSEQLKRFKGQKGMIVRNADTNELVYLNGKDNGGYSFSNEKALDDYLLYGIVEKTGGDIVETTPEPENQENDREEINGL